MRKLRGLKQSTLVNLNVLSIAESSVLWLHSDVRPLRFFSIPYLSDMPT